MLPEKESIAVLQEADKSHSFSQVECGGNEGVGEANLKLPFVPVTFVGRLLLDGLIGLSVSF